MVKTIGGFPNDVLDALWQLVWSGEVTNDTFAPLRSLQRGDARRHSHSRRGRRAFRSRRQPKPPGSEGRWSLLNRSDDALPSATQRQAALAAQLVQRYGILTREMVSGEGVVGGFAGLYPILKEMEQVGKVRRGYFVAGLGAAQFAALGADDCLRDHRRSPEDTGSEAVVLAACDPANPSGVALPWPQTEQASLRPQRVAGARVILNDGALIGYLGRTGQQLLTFLSDSEPEASADRDGLVKALTDLAVAGQPVFITRIDGQSPGESGLADALLSAGFVSGKRGYLHRGQPGP
jgi:ATP-dependent Lhr-like helicase